SLTKAAATRGAPIMDPSFRGLVREAAGLGLRRQSCEKRRLGTPDRLFPARPGRDQHSRGADRVFEGADIALRLGRELFVAPEASGRGLPARQLFVLGL